jgi:hypothetical protein
MWLAFNSEDLEESIMCVGLVQSVECLKKKKERKKPEVPKRERNSASKLLSDLKQQHHSCWNFQPAACQPCKFGTC